jgi:glucan phosphoethanolaminetransferase (alkaline phosphatase superfamily)
MTSLQKDLKEYRGCFIFLGILLLIGIFGGVVQLTLSTLGNFAFLAGIVALVIGIIVWIGLAKGARWAKIIAGIPLSIIGLALTIFITYDFVTSLIKGQSILNTPAVSAGAYGQSAFIFLAVGVALLGGGIMLIGSGIKKK